MNYASSWDFTMANYDAVWAFMVQLGLLLLFLMLGNILRRTIPLFRKCLIPSALLGGTLLLVVNIIGKQFGFPLVDNRIMQVITYHCLAIGFAAMSLKTEKSTHKTNKAQVLEFGALQGGTYMLQAFVGLGVTLVLFLLTRYGDQIVSYVCGLILPLGFAVLLWAAWRRRDLLAGYAYPKWLLIVGVLAWLLTLYLGWNSLAGLGQLWS